MLTAVSCKVSVDVEPDSGNTHENSADAPAPQKTPETVTSNTGPGNSGQITDSDDDDDDDNDINDDNDDINDDDDDINDDDDVNNVSGNVSREVTLESLIDLARSGQILHSMYTVGQTTIDEVIADWGEPDSTDFVSEAKGTYATYNSYLSTFGYNKGDQIFESRSYDDSILSNISLEQITDYLGKPEYNSKDLNGLPIKGYVLNDRYKILFVMTGSGESAVIDHYNVLDSSATANLMLDDKGKEW